jgi:molybdate transport system substrate-binding protein
MGRLGIFAFIAATFAICLALPAPAARTADVLVFAASSTADALAEVNRDYAAAGGVRVAVSAASSGMLARQIDNGAPADLFLSANTDWIEYLSGRGRLSGAPRRPLLRNRLALVAPLSNAIRLDIRPGLALVRALDGGRLAISDPRHVPAGRYAKSALITLGVWDGVEQYTAVGHNVRETLVLVERGEAPLGIVYVTDAAASAKVRLVGVFPPDTHPPIIYWAAVVAGRERPAITAYFRHLGSEAASVVFRRHGFQVD